MTPEELTALVERGDESALIEGLSSLNEQQRGKLSTAAQQLLRRSNKEDVDPSFAYCAELAVLGAGPLSAAMKLEEVVGTDAGRVLADRRPDWLVKWIDGMLVDAFWRIEWETLAPLINSGCVSPSRCQGVVKAMVCGLYFKHWHNHGETSIADDLIGHPELLDSIYSLFDVETHAFHSYAGDPDYVGSSWPRTIIDLCEKEHLDRSRILAKTVGALSQDLKPQSIHGIARLHDDLSPTDDERKTLEDEYLALLSRPVAAVVGFAVRQLKALGKAKRLDGEKYVQTVPNVFQCSAKSHPKAALTLLKTVVKQQPALRNRATLTAAEGLAHPVEDVQDAAMQLVEAWAEAGDIQLAEVLASYRDHLAAPVQRRCDAFRARLGGSKERQEVGEAAEELPAEQDFASELNARRALVEAIPQGIRQALDLPEVLKAAEEGRLANARPWNLFDAPVRSNLERIEPIESLDELFDAVGHAIESLDNGDEVERILDGISRMCDQRPDDFERRAAPLVARANNDSTRESQGFLSCTCDRGIVPVLMAWLTGDREGASISFRMDVQGTWRRCAEVRLRALAERVEKRVAAPLLAAPTHRGGWIDPVVWAKRWRLLAQSNVDVPEIELSQSLLRLTPDGRCEALELIRDCDFPHRDAIVAALGGPIGKFEESSLAVWIAARRARDPEVDLSKESPLQKSAGPDVLQPACYQWKSTKFFPIATRSVPAGREPSMPEIEFEIQPADRNRDPELLAGWSHKTGGLFNIDWLFNPKWVIHWAAMLWPADLDGYWMCATGAYLRRIDQKSSAFEPYSAYLEPLFEPDRPLTEMAALALWIATVSKDADSRTAAIDAWIEMIGDGRGDTRLLGHVVSRLAEGGWLKANRMAEALREVGRVSPLHAWTVVEVIQDFLQSQEALSRDAHHLLQLLRELLVHLGLTVRPDLLTMMESVKGSSKTAKLARQLAALANTEQPERRAALLQLLDAAVARANRWHESV